MSDEGEKTCPLCAEDMDLTDQQLKPCKCGYEICVWCWHHIMEMAEKDDSEGRCPACRTPYDKQKIVGMASNCERLVAEINMERKKSQKAKIKPSEGRKQLSSVRVIQRNLVYIVGLPLNLADEDLLQRREFFGQYGKVLKVSMSRTAAGVIQQFPNNTCSVYITYSREEEAIRCIQSVHGFVLDGRSLKACFGTTKYCHAWLRNVPCTNPDCLYLHEIGSQEDSFTKDEIISAYTRSRVQQITAATSNMLRKSGNTLPPPVDDCGNNSSLSAAKPIMKNTSNSIISSSKGSPLNGSSGRSIALPAAASWGMRASNQLLVGRSTCANGSSKTKTDAVSGALAFSTAVSNTSQTSMLHSDVGMKLTWDEECEITNGKSKLDSQKSAKQDVGADCRATIPEKPAKSIAATTELTLSNPSSKNDTGTIASPSLTNLVLHSPQSSCPEKEGTAETDGKIEKLCSDMSSIRIDTNVRSEISGLVGTNSSPSDFSMEKSPRDQGIQQPSSDQHKEQFSSEATESTAASINGAHVPNEPFDRQTDPKNQSFSKSVSEVDDIISFDNQRLKDPEVVARTNCLPNLVNLLPFSSHSRSHSLQHSDAFSGVNLNVDPVYLDYRSEHSLLHASSNSVRSNGYPEMFSCSARSERTTERSFLPPSKRERRDIGRLQSDIGSISPLDAGESSIISNILSLDLDACNESLTSPQNLAKLLGENDKQPSTLRISNSWKTQSNSQSRFSFARQEDARNQAFDIDSSFSVLGHLPRSHSLRQELVASRNSYMDKLGVDKLGAGNGFLARNFEEPEILTSSAPVFTSNKSSVSRTQVSAPPGFSALNRSPPPPGFSSHERMDQTFDPISGSHLLDSSSLVRNSYQVPAPGNVGSTADIEFMDPAILAVGKGRLQGGLNSPGLDTRSNFPHHLSAFENEARIQLLMQRSLSSHQNLRYTDIGDSYSSLSDPYRIPSRLIDQSQVSNMSPFAQLSRNGLTSNGHWDSWNEVQGGNNVAMAELLRSERLGYNKFYATGYEDSKFRMPSSGDLYNRMFEM
uniref:Uncharacterized protein LOC105628163 isoform X1 n=2 Tax=Rhizophora mucronata TaxID=61149 RepID=A0A2P2MIE9_RHIMU